MVLEGSGSGSSDRVLWQADPFFEAAEDLQESVDRLQFAFAEWSARQQESAQHGGELDANQVSLLSVCDSVRSQVGDFHRALSAITRNPDAFHISKEELDRRFKFVKALGAMEGGIRHAVLTGNNSAASVVNNGEKPLDVLLGAERRMGPRPLQAQEADPLLGTSSVVQQAIEIGSTGGGPRSTASQKIGGLASQMVALQRALKGNVKCIVIMMLIVAIIIWSASAFS